MNDADQELDMFEQASDYVAGFLNGAEVLAFERALSSDPELRAEVERCRLHFDTIGVHAQDPDLGPLGLFRRELWGENWMPWRRRIRLWEFALGGVAAALLTYAVYNSTFFAPTLSEVLQARLVNDEGVVQMELAVDPVAQVVLVHWQPVAPPRGGRFDLWVDTDTAQTNLGALKQSSVQRFKVTSKQFDMLKAGRAVFVALQEENEDASLAGQIIAQGKLSVYPVAPR